MKIIKVDLGQRSYKIVIGSGVIKNLGRYIKLLNIGKDAFIITNTLIKNRYGLNLVKTLDKYEISSKFCIIADSEKSKSLGSCLKVIQELARFDKKRRVFIIALGGGVVGDLSGFIASIYKRGVPYIQIPTTLLACVDSSIGGKTGVDLKIGKNLVGSFYQPRLVVAELSFLKSLNKRQIKAGLAEIIKYAIIKDKKMFEFLEKEYSQILRLENGLLEYIVYCCAQIKARIIQRDEREERGLRTILNFGHTLGHAIESAGGYRKYNHGEAIAVGMVIASQISRRLKLINQATFYRIENLLKAVGLPIFISGIPPKKILTLYHHDKKFIGNVNRFVLIKDIGRATIKQNLPLGVIRDSLAERLSPQR